MRIRTDLRTKQSMRTQKNPEDDAIHAHDFFN
jgi:hypothetical protein